MSGDKKMVGIAGLFDDPDTFVSAAKKVRDRGYRYWDCYSPYPVHGMDEAMGLRSSPVPFITLTLGFAGAFLALSLQGWMSAIDYPVIISNKPLFSWPAFIPITFEIFVLGAAFAAMACILFFCKLLRWHSPLHDSGIMEEITSSRYAVVLESRDALFTEKSATTLLTEAHCREIKILWEGSREE